MHRSPMDSSYVSFMPSRYPRRFNGLSGVSCHSIFLVHYIRRQIKYLLRVTEIVPWSALYVGSRLIKFLINLLHVYLLKIADLSTFMVPT